MAANALAIFEAGVPAHIAAAMNTEGSGNIVARATINALTFEGKVWSINLDGKKTKLMRTNTDGEEEPVSIFTGIVLDYNKDRGREWYAGAYDPKNPTIPDCWSEDSKVPHPNVPSPVSKSCANCPKAKKGSASTQDGNPTVACGQFQKLAIIPAAKVGQFPPLRLRLKITSIFDKSGADSHPNWYAWSQYIDLLVSKGINNTAYLPTKMKFDPATAYPKLLFAPGKDWLDADTLELVKEIAASDATKDVLASTYDPSTSSTGNKPLPPDEEEEELAAAPQPAQARAGRAATAAPATKPAPAPAPAPAPMEEEDEDDAVQTPAQIAAAKRAQAQETANKAAAKAAKAAATRPPADDGDEDDVVTAPPAKPAGKGVAAAATKPAGKTAPAAPKGPVQAPPEVGDLLQEWDE